MVKKKIISVEFRVPNDDIQFSRLGDETSLLDADIILFEPSISTYWMDGESKRYLTDEKSIFERFIHRRKEIEISLLSGRTVFVFLKSPNWKRQINVAQAEEIFNLSYPRRQINTLITPYHCLPIRFNSIDSSNVKKHKKMTGLSFLSNYWKEFEKYSEFQVYIDGKFTNVFLGTHTGNKALCAHIKYGSGNLFLLPALEFPDKPEKDRAGKILWSDRSKQIGHQFLHQILEIDKVIQSENERSPIPTWVLKDDFKISEEVEIENNINELELEIERLNNHKSSLADKLTKTNTLKSLLFEKGKPLELAVLEAMNYLGFESSHYDDGELEIDGIFYSEEGRFIGEAEGKDNDLIKINKLRQLKGNMERDLFKNEESKYAKGILFGNAYRLSDPDSRNEFFSEKCVSIAEQSKIALVRTPDLFDIARYLKENDDKDFAKQCREAIKNTSGEIVIFPEIPK